MTNLLAIETSAHTCSVALLAGADIYTAIESEPRQHTRQLLPQISRLLLDAGISIRQLDAIAFSCGPGSFTGIRLAASCVQGLAFGADIPVIPVSTLQSLAQATYAELAAEHVIVVTDAHGGSIYWGIYQLGQHQLMQPLSADNHGYADQVILPPELKTKQWVGVGDCWIAYQDILRHEFSDIAHHSAVYPQAKDVLTLARAAYAQGHYTSADQAIPVYLYGADRWRKIPPSAANTL